jgi:hypothetical protein
MLTKVEIPKKKTVKIADLMQVSKFVDISDTEQIMVRPLSLREMMTLFLSETDNFISLYNQGIEGKTDVEALTPFLLACPQLIARIIGFAMDEPDGYETIEKHMPATVQLIALSEIWKLSVPDPKKAQELLSVVMALLRKLSERGREVGKKNSLKTESVRP